MKLLLAAIVFFFLSSCSKESRWACFEGAGKEGTLEVATGSFQKLEVEDKIHVILIRDTVEKAVIKGGVNLIRKVDIRNDGYTLRISDRNTCNWSRRLDLVLEVEVHFINIHHIVHWGTGHIRTSDTLKGDDITLDIRNSGDLTAMILAGVSHSNIHVAAGDLKVTGKTGVSYVYNSGYGYVFAEDLSSDITFCGNHNTGNCYVNAKDRLEAEITFEGNVYYKGRPSRITESITGSGKLLPLD